MNVLNAEEMRAADAHTIHDLKVPSLTLMENAASRVVDVIQKRHPVARPILIVCGKGNNGGDGLAAARLLKRADWEPVVLLLASSSDLKNDPAMNWTRANNAGVLCIEDPEGAQLEERLSVCDVVVDAIFGTGLAKPLEGFYGSAVQKINHAGKEVIAIDLPSGLSSDQGELLGPAIRATATVALAALKYGHVLSPACKMCGELYVADIGITTQSTTTIVRSGDVMRSLPHRSVDGHKGTFGHAVVIAGSTGKSGAAYLAGKAALRCGAGLVTVVATSRVQPIIATLGPELMTMPVAGHPDFFTSEAVDGILDFLAGKNAVAIGPGIGQTPGTSTFFFRLLSSIQLPVVMDADALNIVATAIDRLRDRKPSSTILTPHPGEMSRLLQTETRAVQKDRVGAARKLSADTGAIVVLKGYRTIVAEPSGKIWIHLSGGPALASGGTGDVLTGAIAGFLAQRLAPIQAANAGVFLHGLVANLYEARYPQQALNATDVLNYWPDAVQAVRSGADLESEYFKIHFKI